MNRICICTQLSAALLLLLVSCSNADIDFAGKDNKSAGKLQANAEAVGDDNKVSKESATKDKAESPGDEFDEERIALPPEIISGAYLTCVVIDRDGGILGCSFRENVTTEVIRVLPDKAVSWIFQTGDSKEVSWSFDGGDSHSVRFAVHPPSTLLDGVIVLANVLGKQGSFDYSSLVKADPAAATRTSTAANSGEIPGSTPVVTPTPEPGATPTPAPTPRPTPTSSPEPPAGLLGHLAPGDGLIFVTADKIFVRDQFITDNNWPIINSGQKVPIHGPENADQICSYYAKASNAIDDQAHSTMQWFALISAPNRTVLGRILPHLVSTSRVYNMNTGEDWENRLVYANSLTTSILVSPAIRGFQYSADGVSNISSEEKYWSGTTMAGTTSGKHCDNWTAIAGGQGEKATISIPGAATQGISWINQGYEHCDDEEAYRMICLGFYPLNNN